MLLGTTSTAVSREEGQRNRLVLAQELQRRPRTRTRAPLRGCTWRHSSAEVACEAAELRLEQMLFPVAAPPLISSNSTCQIDLCMVIGRPSLQGKCAAIPCHIQLEDHG